MTKLTHTNWVFLIIGILACMIPVHTQAQTPEKVADINTDPQNSIPLSHVMEKVGDKIFFTTNDANIGVYDGTNYSTIDGPYDPSKFAAIGDIVYFTADDGTNGRELWKYDGTTATLIDINPGGDSNPNSLTVLGTELFFAADDGTDGNELWKYDGTTATQVHDIYSGAASSNPQWLTVYNNELIFFADDGVNGEELWKYDGSTASLLEDIRAGAIGSNGSVTPYFEEYNGTLYFSASNGTGQYLWEYDGTDVTNVNNTLGDPQIMTSFNSKLYFYGFDGSVGGELYEYDGTNITNVVDINVGTGNSKISSKSADNKFVRIGSNMYFRADDGVNGYELYKFDGTTVTRIDINTTTNSSGYGHPDYLRSINNKLYLQGYDGVETVVFEYDGTTLTRISIGDAEEGKSPRHMSELNGDVIFTAVYKGDSYNWQLWKYDGTGTVASLITTHGKTESSDPYYATTVGDKVYFAASDVTHGIELWSTDGTTTEMVVDLIPGEEGSEPYNLAVFGNKLLFFAYDGNDYKTYIYDGTDFESFNIEGSTDEYGDMVEYNGALYFSADDGTNGFELMKFDGTTISLVQDINSGSSSSNPANFTVWNNTLYFKANNGTNGNELWKYDGTTAIMAADIESGAGNSSPSELTVVGSNLYMKVYTVASGSELAKFDGTTATIIDVYAGSSSSYAHTLTEYDGKLFFSATDATYGSELRSYDGTDITVHEIKASGDSYASNFFVYNNVLYLNAENETDGRELWKYDGTLTQMELNQSGSSSPSYFFQHGPYMYFNANNDTDGYGLMRYDGTNDVEFLSPVEVYNEDDGFMAIHDNYIYFNAGIDSDYELYKLRAISEETDIITLSFAEQTADATIDATNHTVDIEVVYGTDVSTLTPTIEVSEYATVSPNSGIAQDYSSAFTYTVTSEYGTAQDWTVTVSVEVNNAPTDIAIANSSIDENNSINDVIGAFTTTDVDGSDTHTYSLVAGSGDTDNTSFDISGSNLIALESFDFETKANYSIRVQTNDGKDGVFEKELIITINDVVEQVAQTITFEAIDDQLLENGSLTLSATASSGLDITYEIISGPATVSSNIVTFTGTGEVTVSASQTGNNDFLAATPVEQTFTILKNDQTITFSAIDDQLLEDGSLTLSATASSGLDVTYEIISGPATVSSNIITFTGLGTVAVSASQAGNDAFLPATSVEQSFDIITVTGTYSDVNTTVRFYPNPTTDFISIQGDENIKAVELLDLTGKLVLLQQNNFSEVNVRALKQGNYIMRIHTNKEVITNQIIKQ